MWSWRWLQPAYIDRLYNAGEIVDMPADFVPPAACEPLDAELLPRISRQAHRFVA